MARKSANALAVVSIDERRKPISTPPGLCEAERQLFEQLVNNSPPTQFCESDKPVLIAYVQSVLLCQASFDQACDDATKAKDFHAAAKTMSMLARQLRLCPHARVDPRTLSRRVEDLRDQSERTWLPRYARS